MEPKLNIFQRLELWLRGHTYVGHRMQPGWRGPLPFYAFRCPEHGLVVNYPQGFSHILRCPICQEEEGVDSA